MLTRDPYYSYICDLAMRRDREDYSKLLATLHSFPFEYILDMDENRQTDALEMRRKYFNSHVHFKYDLTTMYHDRPPSVLEIMVALSKRIYDSILDPGDGRDRSNELFALMLTNLDILDCDDRHFNGEKVEETILKLLNREYSKDGKGSLFYIPECDEDMRNMEIWYQAMKYVDSIYN